MPPTLGPTWYPVVPSLVHDAYGEHSVAVVVWVVVSFDGVVVAVVVRVLVRLVVRLLVAVVDVVAELVGVVDAVEVTVVVGVVDCDVVAVVVALVVGVVESLRVAKLQCLKYSTTTAAGATVASLVLAACPRAQRACMASRPHAARTGNGE